MVASTRRNSVENEGVHPSSGNDDDHQQPHHLSIELASDKEGISDQIIGGESRLIRLLSFTPKYRGRSND